VIPRKGVQIENNQQLCWLFDFVESSKLNRSYCWLAAKSSSFKTS